MKPEIKKLLILNLPYLLFVYLFDKMGAGGTGWPPARRFPKSSCICDGFYRRLFQYRAEPSPRRSAYRHCGGGHYPADGLLQRQEREEIPQRHGVRFRRVGAALKI